MTASSTRARFPTREATPIRTLTATLISLTLLASLAVPATAHDATGTYTIASTPGVSVVCSPNCLGIPDANLGGYQFTPTGETPASVTIDDASGAAVPYTICQDLNGDSYCGNTDPTIGPLEPNVDGCGTTATLTGFSATHVTSVFVRMVDQVCSGATSGTITLTYAT